METQTALKVGITGGIGSGKTTICKIFETLGIPVYYADNRAKWLMVNDPHLIAGVKKMFGEQAYFPDGALNRKYLANTVFSNPEQLNQLNQLVHPAVANDSRNWHNSQIEVPYTLKEAALLFESKNHLVLDKVITVFCPENIRLKRVMERDNVSEAEVRSRMNRQMPEEEKLKLADYIIYNDGEKALVPQVLAIHKQLVQIRHEV